MLLLVVGTINVYQPPGPGWRVVHVDASDRGIWDAQQGRNVPVDVIADMRDLPFADATVDRLQSWHALEHVNEQGGIDTLTEFARVVKPGGLLDIRVPNLQCLLHADSIEEHLPIIYGDQTIMPDAELNVHRWGYTPSSLARLLTETGFAQPERQPGDTRDLHLIAERA